MIKVDLLEGSGRPRRSNPVKWAVLALVALTPVVAMTVLGGLFSALRHEILVQQSAVEQAQAVASRLSLDHAEALREEQRLSQLRLIHAELSQALPYYNQWSILLAEVARNMPDSLVLHDVIVERRSFYIDVPDRENPEIISKVSVPLRIVRMSLIDYTHQAQDQTVNSFIASLQNIPELSDHVVDIRLVAQQLDDRWNPPATRYVVECEMVHARPKVVSL